MAQKVILFLILAILWVLVVFNRKLKLTVSQGNKDLGITGQEYQWGTEKCSCGNPRSKWKPMAMNRPDNTLLLSCPQCNSLWEEKMSMYGNKWRSVDREYAAAQYTVKDAAAAANEQNQD